MIGGRLNPVAGGGGNCCLSYIVKNGTVFAALRMWLSVITQSRDVVSLLFFSSLLARRYRCSDKPRICN